MAKGSKKNKQTKKSSVAGENVGVTVEVPIATKIKVTDLKSLSESEQQEILKKVADSSVGFIILNAPFKVRPAESAP